MCVLNVKNQTYAYIQLAGLLLTGNSLVCLLSMAMHSLSQWEFIQIKTILELPEVEQLNIKECYAKPDFTVYRMKANGNPLKYKLHAYYVYLHWLSSFLLASRKV